MNIQDDIDPAAPGDRIAEQYVVDSLIGEGGMGIVYLARDERMCRQVVLKFPKKEILYKKGFRHRFAQEMDALIRFEHPHVVRVYNVGEHANVPFMALQYMEGGTLAQRIADQGPASPAEVLGWLGKIASALDSLHTQGTIHRDVKAGNILFDRFDEPHISDFGIVKVVTELDRQGTGTEPGAAIGSPESLAPEHIKGTYTPAYDQYGLATTVFHALSGKLPFAGATGYELQFKIVQEVPPMLSEIAPHIRKTLSDVVMKALSKSPADRYASCADFVRAFEQASRAPEPGEEIPSKQVHVHAGTARVPRPGAAKLDSAQTTGENQEGNGKQPALKHLGLVVAVVAAVGLFGWGVAQVVAQRSAERRQGSKPVLPPVQPPAVGVLAEDLSGEAVFNMACVACHGAGVAGAPKFGDAAAWKPRITKGADALHKHAIEGFLGQAGFMPPKGGSIDLSDQSIINAVNYMVAGSKAGSVALPAELPTVEPTPERPKPKPDPELVAWNRVALTDSIDEIDQFIRSFPKGKFTEKATTRRTELLQQQIVGRWSALWSCPVPSGRINELYETWTLDVERQSGGALPEFFLTVTDTVVFEGAEMRINEKTRTNRCPLVSGYSPESNKWYLRARMGEGTGECRDTVHGTRTISAEAQYQRNGTIKITSTVPCLGKSFHGASNEMHRR